MAPPSSERKQLLYVASRDLEYAISLTIHLLAELDKTRAQLQTLGSYGGEMVVCPGGAIHLDVALRAAHRSIREVPTEAKRAKAKNKRS